MGSGDMICMWSFMKFVKEAEELLRSCHNSLKGCNVGFIDRRDL
jgi:hypothetical protein